MNCHLSFLNSTRLTIDPTTKSVLHIIKSEIMTISDYTTILKKEIILSLTTRASIMYAHKRILWVGPDPLLNIHSALTQSPKKINKYNLKDKIATVSPWPQKNEDYNYTTPKLKTCSYFWGPQSLHAYPLEQ